MSNLNEHPTEHNAAEILEKVLRGTTEFRHRDNPTRQRIVHIADTWALMWVAGRRYTRGYGDHCGRQMEWLEARGLEADYFPEDDGPEEYSVSVYSELPVYDNRIATYE